MKKLLLNLWNILFDLKKSISEFFLLIKDKIYTSFKPAPKIMTNEETVKYILKTGCSVSRFGDAEVKLISGRNVRYQISTEELQDRLKEVLHSNKKNLLICIPSVFSREQLSDQIIGARKFWEKHLSYCRKYWYGNLIKNKVYGNAFISRCYINVENKNSDIAEYFELIKKLWCERDIVIIEGEKSRLGMGNDLFNNAKSIKRILGPSDQGFSKYSELLNEIKKQDKSSLLLLALGPTASILPYDLCELGYQAIDIGNIDTEYEWFLAGATEKQPVKNKLVYEAMRGTIGEAEDPKYLSQIVAKVL